MVAISEARADADDRGELCPVKHRDADADGLAVGTWITDDGKQDLNSLSPAEAAILDPRHWIVWDQSKAHEVEHFTGERYMVVFYILKRYRRALAADRRRLEEWGFKSPGGSTGEAEAKRPGPWNVLTNGGSRPKAPRRDHPGPDGAPA